MAPSKRQRNQQAQPVPTQDTQPDIQETQDTQPDIQETQDTQPEDIEETQDTRVEHDDNDINTDEMIRNDEEEELPHKSTSKSPKTTPINKGKGPENTPIDKDKGPETPVDMDTSETTELLTYSIDKKLKRDRLCNRVAQILETEMIKSESKASSSNINHTVDYVRTAAALKGIAELVDKQSLLNQEVRRVDSEIKKILSDVSKDIVNTEVLEEKLNWSNIVDISKVGRGIKVIYTNGSRDEVSRDNCSAKFNDYMKLKAIEMKKFPDKESFIDDKDVMDKITKEYLNRDDGGMFMDNLEMVISIHKKNKDLFDSLFYDEFFKEEND